MKHSTSPLSELAARTQAPPISWLMTAALEHPKLISLAAGFTDNPSLPVRETRELFRKILASAETGAPALQYGTSAGDARLRELTAARVRQLDGLPADSPAASDRRLLITNGSQQILYLVAEALGDVDDLVLVEDPTYFVFLGILQSRGLRARGLRLEPDGLDLGHLEETLERLRQSGEIRRLKFLYLVSYFQNPSGISTKFEKKVRALQLLRRYERAAGHPIYLLEDAAYRELRFQDEPARSALAVSERAASRVIYTGTYSKPFASGARVGFGFLPEPVYTAALRLKGNHDFGSSNLLQQLLAAALGSGVYDQHVVRLRRRYTQKARTMTEAIRRHFPAAVEWQAPGGGLYVWPRLPGGMRTGLKSRFFQRALSHDVLYVPGGLCYGDDPSRRKPDCEMRLSFGAADEAGLEEGIGRLGVAMRELGL